uniref:Uncharacterized protein n=1 Tax=Rousettus aegyptiacus TaxID=9407 RepID=A0A7J8BS62_ROUAE|nr:hypothetical protein HJG63_009635 [Rousettus aegyptiacus]
MISVHSEWTLKWSPSPPPPSFLRALIKWGSPPSISPMAAFAPVPACGTPVSPGHCNASLFIYRCGEWGKTRVRGGARVAPRGSRCLPSRHLPPRATAQHSRCPRLCPWTPATQTPVRRLEI